MNRPMDRIDSLDHYKYLLRETKNRLGSLDTNCFLMSKELNSFITDKRFYFLECSDGLLLFVDEIKYYEMYYFWAPSVPFCLLNLDKDVSVVEINSAGKRDNYINRMEYKLTAAGFSYLKTSRLWSLDIASAWTSGEGQYKAAIHALEQEKLKLVQPVPEGFVESVISLWEQELDITDIPDFHKRFSLQPSDRTACFVYDKEEVASAYWWHVSNASAEGRHIVTHPNYTRRGLGTLLLLSCVKNLVDLCIPVLTTYISDDNSSSIYLHKKVGFQPTEKTCKQYILKGSTNK